MGLETSLENDQLSRAPVRSPPGHLTLSPLLLPITSAVGLTTAGAAATVVVGCTAGTPAGEVPADDREIPVVLLLLLLLLVLPVEVGCGGGGHDRGLVVLEEEVGRACPQTARFFLDEVARWRQCCC